MKNRLLCLPFVFAFSISTAQEALPPAEVEAIIDAIQAELQPADGLSGISVPILQSGKLEKKWGKPSIRKSAGGAYHLQYHDPDPKSPFEYVEIMGTSEVIPPLSSVPAERVTTIVNGELGEVEKPQSGKTMSVKWKSSGGKVEKDLRYFRLDSGGGADGPRDRTDAFSISVNGKTGYYVITIESASGATEKLLKMLEVTL